MSNKSLLALATVAFLAAPLTTHAGVGQALPTASSCTAFYCNVTQIFAHYRVNPAGGGIGVPQPAPYVTSFYSEGNECLFLEMNFEGADMEMVLVSPSGKVWRNDDRSPADPRPIIKAQTDVTGWYTFSISHFNGLGANSGFDFYYGRYSPATNPNCTTGGTTTPFKAEADEWVK